MRIKQKQATQASWSRVTAVLHYCLFILILTVAMCLRIGHLTERIWYDELITLHTISLSFSDILDYLRDYSVHPPLYYMLLKTWSLIWGIDIYMLRLFSVVIGVLSIAYLMQRASKIFNRVTAYYIGVLTTLSAFHIYYSQEMRSYSLFFLVIVFSYSQFIHFIRNPGSRKARLLYLLSMLLLGYVHIYGLVVILTQFLHGCFYAYSLKSRDRFKKLIILQGLFALGFLPWFPAFIEQVSHRDYWNWIPETGLVTLRSIFFDFANRSELVYFMALALLLAACLSVGLRKSIPGAPVNITSLLLWLLFPLGVALFLSLTFGSVLVSRYAQQVFFTYLLLLAAGFGAGYNAMISRWLKVLFLSIFLFFILLQAVDYSRNGVVFFRDREAGWEEVVTLFLENRSQDDLLLAYTELSPAPDFPVLKTLVEYYDPTGHLNYSFINQRSEKVELPIDEYPGAWLIIFSFDDVDRAIENVHDKYLPGYKLKEEFKNQTHALLRLVKKDVPQEEISDF